jgi:hypothetical protein
MTDTVLQHEQVASFVEHGYVTIPDCFTREDAQPWLDEAWIRLGYAPHDPDTWVEKRVHMPSLRHVEVSDFAPKVWGAADGDFFRHFLDSPEQGLLTIVLWSDIEHRGGGTFVAADSVAPVARLLAERRDGVLPDDFDYEDLISQCTSFVETTGRLGDVVLMHPYMPHAVSQNHRGTARFITNPPIALKEPMRFDRADPAEHSPVERAVLRALGVQRLDYRPTAARESVVPERVLLQQRMGEEEQARLAEASS